MAEFDLVLIGHAAKDIIVVGGKRDRVAGGGVYYGSIALTHLGFRVAVVTKLRKDDFWIVHEMEQEGVIVFAHPAPETSGIENVYLTPDMERRKTRPLGFAGPFSRDEIPDLDTRLWDVTPLMTGEVDLPMLRWLAGKGTLALDAQGFVRVRRGDELVFEDWPEKTEGLPLVDFLKVDAAEAEVLTGTSEIHKAALELAEMGAGEVVLTHNEGLLVYSGGKTYEAAFHFSSLEGRTGRGDTCFAVYLGWRLDHPPEEAAEVAAEVTSMKVAVPGPWRGRLEQVHSAQRRLNG